MDEDSSPQASPLAAEHQKLDARFAAFAGWEMPIQYAGIMPEHRAVRESCGVFDISHMGQFLVEGDDAATWLNGLLTNDVGVLASGEGQYTLMLNEAGGVIDDLILYRLDEKLFFLVVNAAKISEDLEWLAEHRPDGIQLSDESTLYGGLAIQGPEAVVTWEKMRGGTTAAELDLPTQNGIVESSPGGLVLCRTGYTGEDGFELFAPVGEIATWFRAALDAGAAPCGLGARDTLRLEKCYPLNGSDLDSTHTPLEAGLGFFCKLDKPNGFVARDVLARQKADGLKTKLSAIRQIDKGPPPRHDYLVFVPGVTEPVAALTSGSLSPTLGDGIGMAYLPAELAKPGTALEIEVRGRRFAAEVVKKPFV
ncbi:MAG: glycine cleavage system aminomethyltransferase GcvT [Verrucomicrobiae bacterium]|nr:glycine cleavage system aminomethyltransferase GcvT [Verrucomicrobiae bacterium]